MGGINLEYRKLIKFGNSSFVISVPNSWIKRNNLKKGQMVFITENLDNELILSATSREKDFDKKEISIDIDGKDVPRIKREIVSAYIKNYNTIKINGKEINKYFSDVKNIVQNLMALEIVDQSSDAITTKDFLDYNEVTLHEILRKVDNITRSMFADIKHIPKENYSTGIVSRDEEVNRMVYLIIRTMRFALDYPNLVNKNNKLNTSEILNIWDVSLNIERVADGIKRIARKLDRMTSQNKAFKIMVELSSDIEKFYWDTMKAYYTNDAELAYILSDNKRLLSDRCNELHEKFWNVQNAPIILENFKDIISSVHNIGRRIYS